MKINTEHHVLILFDLLLGLRRVETAHIRSNAETREYIIIYGGTGHGWIFVCDSINRHHGTRGKGQSAFAGESLAR
jgi:hypothetical protein